MGILVSTYMQEAANAQYQNSTIGTMLGIMRAMMTTQNITGSVRIAPTLLQTIQSKASVTLTTAITNAERGVGPNSHAIFARLGIENGYLVYIINVIDANHNIHRITVDAGNGKVLTSQQIPGGMLGQGGMMGLGGMLGQGGMMGLGNGPIFTNPGGNRSGAIIQNTNGTLSGHNKVSILPNVRADRSFSPNAINVKIGDILTWTNYDVMPHTVTAGTGPTDPNKGKEFDSGLSTPLMPGKTFSHRFTRAGEFPYFCQLHPAMAGTITVS